MSTENSMIPVRVWLGFWKQGNFGANFSEADLPASGKGGSIFLERLECSPARVYEVVLTIA
jgi:hypothetical protein